MNPNPQIASGVILGYVGDHVLGRKGVLLLSFAGSAFSYSLAAASYSQGAIWGVVASRVIVGLVKQTMTISKVRIESPLGDPFETCMNGARAKSIDSKRWRGSHPQNSKTRRLPSRA